MMMMWLRVDRLWNALFCVGIWLLMCFYWTRKPTIHAVTYSDPSLPVEEISSQGQDICRRHGWKNFKPATPQGRRKVYDLVMVNNELDWLEIRLNTTYDYVDYFVIVEADKTFTGLDKPLIIHDSMDKFARYRDKIIYHQLEFPPDFNPARTWDREDLQRNAMFTQVFPKLQGAQAPTMGDAIIVADVDEIPRPQTLTILRHCQYPRRLTLRSHFYYYGFQFLHKGPQWAHPQATYYQGPHGTVLPAHLREGDGGAQPLLWLLEKADLYNAAWHCSSCFATMAELLDKMRSFSHVWMNHDVFRDRDRIADRVRTGRDLWDRATEHYERVDANTDVPPLLLRERARFHYLLERDGPSAGFEDHEG